MHSLIFLTLLTLPIIAAPQRRPSYEPINKEDSSSNNLFLHAKATASGHWDKFKATLAVDGDLNTTSHWACENLPVWHQLDLGQAKTIRMIRVWPYWGDGRIYQYKVEGSLDGSSWAIIGDHSANSIASSPDGDTFRFDARELRYIRTTILKNSRGDTTGGHIVEIAGYADNPTQGLTGGIGNINTRYPANGKCDLNPADHGIKLRAWRGERVNAQVVVTSADHQENIRLEVHSPIKNHPNSTTANFIRYTLADGKAQGDVIDSATSLPLHANTNRPIWISIDVPADAAPGTHRGGLRVRSNTSTIDFPLELEILDATIPPPAQWKFHLDLWQHPQAVARWHDVPAWSDEHFAHLKPIMKRLADAGQKTITTTLVHEAWTGQTYDEFPAMVQWIKKSDGTWQYDYTIFDRWVTFMRDECGMKHAYIHCYTMIPWSLKFRYFDEKTNANIDASLTPGTPEYEQHWGPFLENFSRHLEKKGWLDMTNIGIDERPDHLMRGAIATLRKHAPRIGIASAINHPSDLTKEFRDISPILGHCGGLLPLTNERRAAGKITTYYTCCAPMVPNTFTFSPPAESEWIGIFAAANGMDGYLRWAYNSWVHNPLESTDFTTWPSGDCFLVYPGNRSSVRFERLRDGIESWEKIRIIREKAATSPEKKSTITKLEELLKSYTPQRAGQSGAHQGDVEKTTEAIDQAASSLW